MDRIIRAIELEAGARKGLTVTLVCNCLEDFRWSVPHDICCVQVTPEQACVKFR